MNYYEVYGNVWSFHKKHAGSSDWQGITAQADELIRKYNDNPFLKELVMTVSAELERKGKENATTTE